MRATVSILSCNGITDQLCNVKVGYHRFSHAQIYELHAFKQLNKHSDAFIDEVEHDQDVLYMRHETIKSTKSGTV